MLAASPQNNTKAAGNGYIVCGFANGSSLYLELATVPKSALSAMADPPGSAIAGDAAGARLAAREASCEKPEKFRPAA